MKYVLTTEGYEEIIENGYPTGGKTYETQYVIEDFEDIIKFIRQHKKYCEQYMKYTIELLDV